ncbi:MAG: hypothetical protein IH859_00975 [Chloroflexi bacterium]|nr:hypothetical protein [Chloroflexota bacterium]
MFGIAISLFSEGFGAFLQQSQWDRDLLSIWGLVNSFPGNVFTRLPLIAFMAEIFAGEYEWGTWKNIVHGVARILLLSSKLITLTAIALVSLFTTSLVIGTLEFLAHLLEGVAYGPALTTEVIFKFAETYILEATLTAVSMLVLVSFVGISAMLTKSVIGSMLLGFGLSIIDPVSVG